MTTLTEQAEEYAEPLAEDLHRVVRRAFMAGALAALTSKAPREQLIAECVQFGRAVGTAAERDRHKKAGRVAVTHYIYLEDREKVARYIKRLNERAERRRAG